MALTLFGIFNFLVPKDGGSRRVARAISYGADPRMRLDIYGPKAKGKMPLPVVFFVYGGSWMDGDRGNYEFAGRAIAALGYVVVIADYRLVPQVEYPAFLLDCAQAFAWTVANIAAHGGDPTRMALAGHSAGAYNAAMLALDPLYRQAVPALAGVRCLVGLSGPYDFFPFDGPISLRTFGAVSNPAMTQPINHVTSAAPPMLLATGADDTLVYPRNSVALARRLEAAGVATTVIQYPKLDHPGPLLALSRVGRRLAPVYRDVAAYLGTMLA